MVERTDYLRKLERLKNRPLIKVLTGLRRCGKSTLLAQFSKALASEGIAANRIVSLNLEGGEFFDVKTYRQLYDLVCSRLRPDVLNYVLIDEVQNVSEFEKALDALHVRPDVDLYVTGSNAKLLSGELATLLSGRYVEIPVYPFSFKEYCAARSGAESLPGRAYPLYTANGTLPYAAASIAPDDVETRRDYLNGILNTILLKDVVQRLGVKNVLMLEEVTRFLCESVGSIVSIQKIRDTLASAGRSVSSPTIETYVRALRDAFVFYQAERYDIRGREVFRNGAKYYLGEIGFRSLLLGDRAGGIGHVLENVIYLELLRRGHRVFVGRSGSSEIDFVTVDGPDVAYYQVALTVRDETTFMREMAPLKALDDNYPKFLLTLDDDPPAVYDGIRQMNALNFLLAP